MSAGLHGTSKWCKAISLSCTFVPAPIFDVEPNRKRICPERTLENSTAFCLSVLASWINAISSSGTPFSINFCSNASYTLKEPSFLGVEVSQKTSCADFCSFVSCQTLKHLSAHAETLLFAVSGSISLMRR